MKPLGRIAATIASFIGKPQIDDSDGVDTTTERMLPGSEPHEKFWWAASRITKGLLWAVIAINAWGLSSIRTPLLIGLGVWMLIELIDHLNTLLSAKTWSLFSGLLIGFFLVLGLAVL